MVPYHTRPLSFRASSGTVGRSENPKGQAVIQGLLKVIHSEKATKTLQNLQTFFDTTKVSTAVIR